MSSSSAQVDAPACDFTLFVATKRQLSEEAASRLIGDWLMSYEPGPSALRHREELRGAARRPAGVASAARVRRSEEAA